MRARSAVVVFAAIGAVTAGAPAAASASAVASSESVTASSCRDLSVAGTLYQSVALKRCDDGWFGSRRGIVKKGDQVWLVSAAGSITGLRTARWNGDLLTTPMVGIRGGPWKACARFAGKTWCTARG
ncbi:hypothetical protein FB561_2986 [Kribbella amoyensis]|uniref:Uncharacterized protein n=1 Tax=Kribbella amoyensis TaxID=996641 RepID=A0A561BSS7_9ACTN|nr:hypothetical protein FB561_2986 [Kribbella amoyensis]